MKAKRRSIASASRIEEIIAAGQRRGLTVTGLAMYPDGRSEVHFGVDANAPKKNTGWEDI